MSFQMGVYSDTSSEEWFIFPPSSFHRFSSTGVSTIPPSAEAFSFGDDSSERARATRARTYITFGRGRTGVCTSAKRGQGGGGVFSHGGGGIFSTLQIEVGNGKGGGEGGGVFNVFNVYQVRK